MKKIFAILLILNSFIFAQPITIGIQAGMLSGTKFESLNINNGVIHEIGGINELTFLIDYGKQKTLVEPYIKLGILFQVFPKTEFQNVNYLKTNGKFIGCGLKKTIKIGNSKTSLNIGVDYLMRSYEYESIFFPKIEKEISSLSYQAGVAIGFEFIKFIDVIFSYEFSYLGSKKYLEKKYGFNYEFSPSPSYNRVSFGLNFDISRF